MTCTCDKCQASVDGVIGGRPEQRGGFWCVFCCDQAALKLPEVLRHPFGADRTNAIRDEWMAQRRAKKLEQLEKFVAERKGNGTPAEPAASTPAPARAAAPPSDEIEAARRKSRERTRLWREKLKREGRTENRGKVQGVRQ